MRSVTTRSLLLAPLGLAALSLAAGSLSGCSHNAPAAAPPPKPAGPPRISEADLQTVKPNEAGAVMIVMYHRFVPTEPNNDLNRQPEMFRQDLEGFYKRGYRPVTVSELIENKMDVPAGKTPIVLTFDDALPTQFRLVTGKDGQPHIDPDCAVGIIETFHKQHSDWATKGTFFVLPNEGSHGREPFGQPESVGDKFNHLLDKGYELANHTSTHPDMHSMSAPKVQKELATAVHDIQQIAPKATMQTLALPYGRVPRGDEARQALISGSAGGTTYKHKAVLLAAWRPVLSPVTRNDKKFAQLGVFCTFDPYHLERIKPDPREASKPGTLEYYLKYFDANPRQRYISDGNDQIVTVPAGQQNAVDPEQVKAQGKILQIYGGASKSGASKDGKGSSSLSVE